MFLLVPRGNDNAFGPVLKSIASKYLAFINLQSVL